MVEIVVFPWRAATAGDLGYGVAVWLWDGQNSTRDSRQKDATPLPSPWEPYGEGALIFISYDQLLITVIYGKRSTNRRTERHMALITRCIFKLVSCNHAN